MNLPENYLSDDAVLLEQIAQGSEAAFNLLFENTGINLLLKPISA